MFNNLEDMLKSKKQVLQSNTPEKIKKQILQNLDWGILSIKMNRNENTRREFRDMVSKKIHIVNPNYINYIKEDEIENAVDYFMKNYSGTGIKSVFVIESGKTDVNDLVLFYE